MSEEELTQLQRQVQRERKARKEAERLLEEKSLELYRTNQQLQRASDYSWLLLDSIVEGAYGVNIDGYCTFVNASCLRILGYRNGDELLGKHMHTLMNHSHADGSPIPVSECRVFRVYQTLQQINVSDEMFCRKDGSSFPVEYRSSPILVDDAAVGAIVTFNDISERKQIEEALKASEVRFKLIFNEAPLGIALIDSLTGHIYSVNPMFAKIAGRSMEEMAHIDWMSITHPDDLQKDLDNMALLNGGEISGFQMEKRFLHHDDGTPIWINMTIAPVYAEDKANPRHLCMIEDITERKQMEDQIRQLAFHDPLTKLPNRRLVTDRLIQAIASSKRSGCYNALMFIDLDNFKPVNDTHGHAAGDLLLIEVADRLRHCVREVDTVGRIGGDEFVVMLIDLNEDRAQAASQAKFDAEKIRIRLSEPYLLTIKHEGKPDTIVEHLCSASIGVALFSKYETNHNDILKWADEVMYQAKDAGRDLIRFYDSGA